MKLQNSTPYPAHLFRGCIDEQRVLAGVIVRITHDIVDGRLRPAADQPWPVSAGPYQSPLGPMPSDQRFVRDGVDVLLFGAARSEGGRAVPRIDVGVQVGRTWRSELVAWGERVWRTGVTGLVPSAPEPVSAVPLTLAHAYGGADEWDGLEVAYPDNPEGRGFYLERSRAHGRLLPNLEDPAAPIRAWDDRPEPVGTGTCPQHFGPRVRRGLDIDATTGAVRQIKPAFFNDAFPKMIAPRALPGDRVEVRGVREDGPLVFSLPPIALRVRVQIGDDGGERTPVLDQIGVDADARRVFLTYRYPFRYVVTPHQRRSCTLGLVEPD
ncbi:DUF2169 domain-containing protein [Nannocystis sp. SCPEA4]|uniref:DUF2169 family type VI secretion system accessory protein n=1 Tax=Nannocystis sp. SCPEA4 TaxID=2996787 RepID=UPI00226D6DDE|nr:DUF2169 domain-containing protein [Nannocystis sp. SCPEA4]MCY1059377.1 DUF2169 domain-containing protein [Nannocystis sp. SCPEA4]